MCDYAEFSTISNFDTTHKLSILTVNIRGIKGKFQELLSYIALCKFQFTFIVLIEVWLWDYENRGFDIPNYKSYSCLRNDRIGGGIIIYCNSCLNTSIFEEKTGIFPIHESLTIKSEIRNLGDIYVSGIYRPPHLSMESFNSFMEDNLVFFCNKKCIIAGDLNCDLMTETIGSKTLTDLMLSFNFTKCINKPTYFSTIKNSLTSCLDHYWHNFESNFSSFIVGPPLADHMLIVLFIDIIFDSKKIIPISFRNFNYRNKCNFVRNIENEVGIFDFQTEDVDLETSRLLGWFKYLADKYFPIKFKNLSKKRAEAPWLTNDIIRCIDKKHRWFKLLKAKLITYECFKKYCNMLKKLLKSAESNYYNKRFKSFGNDSKKNWKLLNSLIAKKSDSKTESFLINGVLTNDDQDIAECFSEHFYSLPYNIRMQIPNSNIDGISHISRLENSLVLFESTPNEVNRLIKGMKQGRKTDEFILRMVRLATHPFAFVLSKLFNIYMSQGRYPNVLKVANIVPIYKSGSRKCIENYRPIAVLKNLNKLFEKLLCQRLLSFLNCNGILSQAQFGFKKGYSTEIAILQLLTYILPAFQNRGYALAVFLDYSKAFNTVNPQILLTKLKRYGIRGLALKLLSSYLENRIEYVTFNGKDSEKRIVNLGVPQGSCLGPLLYVVYTNDFCKYLETINKVLYADDTSLVICDENVDNISAIMNESFTKLYDWCNFNGLALNCSKTKAVLFTNKLTVENPLQIAGNRVEYVNAYRYLGLILDSKLKYQDHINGLQTRLSQLCGISYKIGPHLSLNAAKSFYYSFIYSVLSYCITVWGGILLTSTKGNRLKALQVRLVKNLFSKFFGNASTIDVFKRLEILPIDCLYKFRVACLMFKLLKLEFYPNILAFINPEFSNHTYETRRRDLILPFPNVEAVRSNFKYQFLKIWNEIPNNIKSLESHDRFKREYQNYLIVNYISL